MVEIEIDGAERWCIPHDERMMRRSCALRRSEPPYHSKTLACLL